MAAALCPRFSSMKGPVKSPIIKSSYPEINQPSASHPTRRVCINFLPRCASVPISDQAYFSIAGSVDMPSDRGSQLGRARSWIYSSRSLPSLMANRTESNQRRRSGRPPSSTPWFVRPPRYILLSDILPPPELPLGPVNDYSGGDFFTVTRRSVRILCDKGRFRVDAFNPRFRRFRSALNGVYQNR